MFGMHKSLPPLQGFPLLSSLSPLSSRPSQPSAQMCAKRNSFVAQFSCSVAQFSQVSTCAQHNVHHKLQALQNDMRTLVHQMDEVQIVFHLPLSLMPDWRHTLTADHRSETRERYVFLIQ